MSKEPIRVGIIGADTKASWAGASHVPALAAQPEFRLAAVATRREESARSAAETFGADQWFADPMELIRDPDIDLVTVAVKVPAHRELVLAALAAGKAVYCEAPWARRPSRVRKWQRQPAGCTPPSACRAGRTPPFDARPR